MHGVPPALAPGASNPSAPDYVSSTLGDTTVSAAPDWLALTDFLQDYQDDSILLSFAAVGQIIGDELPSEATTSAFWSNSVYNEVARRWWDAGFRSSTRDVPDGHIRFDRVTYTGLAT